MPVYSKDTEVFIFATCHIEFTVSIEIKFYKEGRIVCMRIEQWGL